MKFTGDARGGDIPSSHMIRRLLPAAVSSYKSRHRREQENREYIRQHCAPITVDPKLLALAVNEERIDPGMAVLVLSTLILDAHRQKVADTLGVELA